MAARVSAIATVAAAVVVFGVAGYLITHNSSPSTHSGAAPGYSAGPTMATSTSTAPSTSTSPAAAGAVIAFVGDDWTAGTGAANGFVTRVGAALGVSVQAFAVPGGGYARTGDGKRTYADLVAAVAATHPAVVVVSGGRNDAGDYVPTLRDAATKLFAALHRVLPVAKLVAVAPFWGDSAKPAKLAPVAAAVEAGVTAAGGSYLDLPDPLVGHPGWMADAADPNGRGYAAIAAALAPRLRPLLP